MSQRNNERIAKNTIYLYIRTGITMLVALYTSRVVLNALGVEDFGIWGVLGGVVSMFGFVNQSLSSSVFRYITHAIGTGDRDRINRTYNASIVIHVGLAIAIFILCETLGEWFLAEKLVVPVEKREMAHMVFHIVVLTSAVSLLSVPFNSVMIAYERMNVYAYLAISDAAFKLLIAGVVHFVSDDKLVWYAGMMLFVTTLMLLFAYTYVRINFRGLHFQKVRDGALFKSLLGFSGWSLWGNLAWVGYTQGINMLLNVFFGPIVNAARGIAVQIEAAVRTFVVNFQTAINPQIIKSYAQEEFAQMHSLMCRSSKFSVFLLFVFALPAMLETETILYFWLGQIPEHTTAFVRIMFPIMALETMSNSIMTGVVATGNIRKYQLVVGSLLLTIVPISYIVLRSGASAESVFLVYLAVEVAAVAARLLFARKLVRLSVGVFFRRVLLKVLVVVISGSAVPILVWTLMPEGMIRLVVVGMSSLASSLSAIYLVGLDAREKEVVTEKISRKFFR